MADRYDVIVIGGGAAGLTAALYTARRHLTTLVVSQDLGGQAATTALVENYPGLEPIDGLILMKKFRTQAEKFGAGVKLEEARSVKKNDDGFLITTTHGEYRAAAVILAYGLTHRRLNVPGEERLAGHGVFYCATCDGPRYKGGQVVVIGGGNSAMDAALLLSRLDNTVALVTVNTELHGERVLIERLQDDPRITVYTTAITKAITGQNAPTGVVIEHQGQTIDLPAEAVFINVGFVVDTRLIKGLVDIDNRHQVIIDPHTNGTSVPGLFAAGDATDIPHKQIIISAGEGAKAALGVYHYLQSIGRAAKSGSVDWGVSTPLRHADIPTP